MPGSYSPTDAPFQVAARRNLSRIDDRSACRIGMALIRPCRLRQPEDDVGIALARAAAYSHNCLVDIGTTKHDCVRTRLCVEGTAMRTWLRSVVDAVLTLAEPEDNPRRGIIAAWAIVTLMLILMVLRFHQ